MSRLSPRAKAVRHSSAPSERRRTICVSGPISAFARRTPELRLARQPRAHEAGCRVLPHGRRLSAIVRRRPNVGGPFCVSVPISAFARLTPELRLARQPKAHEAGCRLLPHGRRLSAIVRRRPNVGGPFCVSGPISAFARLTPQLRLAGRPKAHEAGCRLLPHGRRLSAIVRRRPTEATIALRPSISPFRGRLPKS